MTKFQALFVLYLRHEKFCGCSWRALAAHYGNRYNMITGEFKSLHDRIVFDKLTYGGNQIDGIILEEEASKILKFPDDSCWSSDLYECDLSRLDCNLKRHLK